MTTDSTIFVRSHVARDLQQNAALFKTDRLVVWEYVSNGLQYVDPGTKPIVRVVLDAKQKRISISDNGRGMDWSGLRNFFVMHGENLDRRQGLPGRGRFGTGKSAAFGIAELLRVTTIRSGLRCVVELSRADIDNMGSEDPVPVQVVEKDTPSGEPNGTVIEIERLHIKSLDQAGVVRYIERHLARWPRNVTVYVNQHECEFAEPAVSESRVFHPDKGAQDLLGDVALTLKVSKGPLEEDLRGVSIYSNGVWHETTMAGSEGREMAQYMFGELDVPRLDEDTSPISPFDLSRSMQLNPANELVRGIYSFVGRCIEELRHQLVETEKKRRQLEEVRKLAVQADKIASIINEDFDQWRQRLAKMKAMGGAGLDSKPSGVGDDDLIFGSDVPAIFVETEQLRDCGTEPQSESASTGGHGTFPSPEVVSSSDADVNRGRPGGGKDGRQRPRGGFQVKFESMGPDELRARYVSGERVIYVNLDHPQLVAARGKLSTEEPLFKNLSYEIAFSEYAVALASELAKRDEYVDPTDPIFDIRDTINRIARRAAHLFDAD